MEVVDDLVTNSATAALSARQGMILNGKATIATNQITALTSRVTALESGGSGGGTDSFTKIWT